jgi:hypothetical protein
MKDRVRVLESQVNDLYQALQVRFDLHDIQSRGSTNYHRTATNRINEMSPTSIQNYMQSSAELSNILNEVSAPTAGVGFSLAK